QRVQRPRPRWAWLCALALWSAGAASAAQLNEHCTISILNRTTQVRADGTWVLPNVPTNFGPLRARATCLENGVTQSGQSDLFTVPTNGTVTVGEITFETLSPVPTTLKLFPTAASLTAADTTVALDVTALFGDGTVVDMTTDPSTTYLSSNPAIGTVSNTGVVTAVSSGPLVITVLHEA